MKTIAVAIDMEWPLRRHHDIFAGIQTFASKHHPQDWRLIPDNFPDAVLTGKLRGPQYSGVIGRLNAALQDVLTDLQVPAVNVWIRSSAHGKVPSVLSDIRSSARMAVEHFAARGIRRVAYIGIRNDLASQIQEAAFKAEARKRGFPCSSHKCRDSVEQNIEAWSRFCRQVDGWLARWEAPIGVFTHHDLNARQLSTVATRAGWVIPDQLSVLGSGNNTVYCESMRPTLSSIHPGYRQVGYRAAEVLDAIMSGARPPSEPLWISPVEVAMRRSSDVFAVADPAVAAALRFMAEHCHQCLNVDIVAAKTGVGRRTLERRFRSTLGRSINQELNRLRVERMKRFLIETDDPIKSLVSDAGFGSAEQMRLVFRDMTGYSPGSFREQHRERFLTLQS